MKKNYSTNILVFACLNKKTETVFGSPIESLLLKRKKPTNKIIAFIKTNYDIFIILA